MGDGKGNDHQTMTTKAGRPVEDNKRSMTAGQRGPVLMQDVLLVEKMAQFNRERVPERVVHAKGYGAWGSFEVTNDITEYCCADFLSSVGKTTELFARFSTVGGEKGSADTARDPRGFGVKFYTAEGNWDMVGNNTPVFFVRDPIKFSDFIRTQKREPRSHLKPHWRRWDYWSMTPEAMHQVMVLYSDRGTPYSARFMNGYSSHTMSVYNAKGERFWVKWHFKTDQGILNLTADEAQRLSGEDPDYSTRDLFNAIHHGEFPSWTVHVQVMPMDDAESYDWHPFDLTKVWRHSDYPLIEVGRMTLNRNPDNYFQDVEQSAFEPGNLVPGIDISPDKMLQNRVLSYPDAHRYRIGPNYHQIPVNQARGVQGGARTYHRDGHLRVDGNGGGSVDYEPNTFGGPVADPQRKRPTMPATGDGDRWSHFDEDHRDWFGQPRLLWSEVMDDGARQRLVDNIVESMQGSPERIQRNMLWQFFGVHEDFGDGVAQGLGLSVDDATRRGERSSPPGEAHFVQHEIPGPEAPASAQTIEDAPSGELQASAK
jgi:catalase